MGARSAIASIYDARVNEKSVGSSDKEDRSSRIESPFETEPDFAEEPASISASVEESKKRDSVEIKAPKNRKKSKKVSKKEKKKKGEKAKRDLRLQVFTNLG